MSREGGVPEDMEKIVPNSSAPPAKQSGGNGDAAGGEMFAKAMAYGQAVTERGGKCQRRDRSRRRRTAATVLERWLHTSSLPIPGRNFPMLAVI